MGRELGIDFLVVNHLQGMIWIFRFQGNSFFFGPVNYFFYPKTGKKGLIA